MMRQRSYPAFLVFSLVLASAATLFSAGCQPQAPEFPQIPKGTPEDSPWYHIPDDLDVVLVLNMEDVAAKAKADPSAMKGDWKRDMPQLAEVFEKIGFNPDAEIYSMALGIELMDDLYQIPAVLQNNQNPFRDWVVVFKTDLDLEKAMVEAETWYIREAPPSTPSIDFELFEEGETRTWGVFIDDPALEVQGFHEMRFASANGFVYLAPTDYRLKKALAAGKGEKDSIVDHDAYKAGLRNVDQNARFWGVGVDVHTAFEVTGLYMRFEDGAEAQLSLVTYTPAGAESIAKGVQQGFDQARQLLSGVAPHMEIIFDGLQVSSSGPNAVIRAKYSSADLEKIGEQAAQMAGLQMP